MKAVLVVEMPKCCNECKCNFDHWCSFDNFERYINDLEQKPKWCPLRPLPEEKNIQNVSINDFYDFGRAVGWNACIKAITGETE